MSATFFLPDKGCGSISAHPTSFGVVLHLLIESAPSNLPIDTDPELACTFERMSNDSAARMRLVDMLGKIALYNDKGCEWSRHSTDRIALEQARAQAQIDRLIGDVGEAAFPAQLLHALKAGIGARDASVDFQKEVARWSCRSV
jgi:hypothetical protein